MCGGQFNNLSKISLLYLFMRNYDKKNKQKNIMEIMVTKCIIGRTDESMVDFCFCFSVTMTTTVVVVIFRATGTSFDWKLAHRRLTEVLRGTWISVLHSALHSRVCTANDAYSWNDVHIYERLFCGIHGTTLQRFRERVGKYNYHCAKKKVEDIALI